MLASGAIRAATRFSRSAYSGYNAGCCRHALYYSTENKMRYYTKKHEWVSIDENIGTVGVSHYAQDALGEVVFIQLPDVGQEISAGDESGALESVKAAAEVYSPVSGTVTEKNTALESTPSLVNKSCYGEGWLFRIKLSNRDEVQHLMDQPTYDNYLKESGH
ncbi:uncharacterized protein LOC114240518 [Bombyx mandarina]|uniref:Glycine cleavage system H protein n=2 Tax=Bombyx TaxID=7090 RepID=A0A8R1WJ04_BOMMO|nr:glycine cleavage system H protein [Bombyx mori]XP_028026888.1 uncharacterized protein LOC114240518 [Bombyx mandarina]